MHRSRVRVRFRDLDVLGHVNSSVFFTYMESARVGFAREVFDPSPVHEVPFVVVDARCEYRRAIREICSLEVACWVSRVGESSWDLDYAIEDEQGDRFAVGRTTQVFFDHEAQESKTLPPGLRDQLEGQTGDPLAFRS